MCAASPSPVAALAPALTRRACPAALASPPQRTREYEDLVAALRFLRCASLRLVPSPERLAPHFRVLWRGGRYEVVYFFRPVVGAGPTRRWAESGHRPVPNDQVVPHTLPWSLLPSSVQKGAPLRIRPFVIAKGVRAASPRGSGVARAAQAALARDRANGVAVASFRAHVSRCTAALRGYKDAVARDGADDASPAARADAVAAGAVASELAGEGFWEGVREALEEGGSDILPEVGAVALRLGAGRVTLSRSGMDECVPHPATFAPAHCRDALLPQARARQHTRARHRAARGRGGGWGRLSPPCRRPPLRRHSPAAPAGVHRVPAPVAAPRGPGVPQRAVRAARGVRCTRIEPARRRSAQGPGGPWSRAHHIVPCSSP